MALIKSNRLVQQGVSVVAGNQVIPDADVFVPEYPLEQVVPQSEPTDEGEDYQDDSSDSQIEEELVETPAIDLRDAEVAVEGLHLQEEAAFSQIDAQIQGEFSQAMGMALEDLQIATAQSVEEVYSDPMVVDDVMGNLIPYIEHQASAEMEEKLVPKAHALKWQEMAATEEKIQTYLVQYTRQYTDTPADQLLAVLSEKEQILMQARIQAQAALQDAEQQSLRIVAEAEARATQTMLDVERSRNQIISDLEQKGYAQGYQEGRAQADQEGAEILSEAIETLNRVRMAYPKAVKDNEENLLKLAIQIAERIIAEEVSIRPEICQSILETAVRKVSDLEQVIIKTSEEDLPIILEKEDYFRTLLKNVKHLDFVSSKKVGRGGVLIETTAGTVDAQISTQLSVLKEAFDRLRAEYAEDPSDQAWEEVDQ